MKRPDLRRSVAVHPLFVAAHDRVGVHYYRNRAHRLTIWPPRTILSLFFTAGGSLRLVLTPRCIEWIRRTAAEAIGYTGPLFQLDEPMERAA